MLLLLSLLPVRSLSLPLPLPLHLDVDSVLSCTVLYTWSSRAGPPGDSIGSGGGADPGISGGREWWLGESR
jgi:hypothetical protein